MPDTPLCGLPHYTWPETVCTEPDGHYRPELDPHAGPLVIDGRQRGGCSWDQPTQPPEPPMPDATPARDEYEQATGHQATCTVGFNDQCTCGPSGLLRADIAEAIRQWHGDWNKATFAEAAEAVLGVVQPLLDRAHEAATAVNGLRAQAEARAERAEVAIRRVRELHQRSDQRRPLDLSLEPIIHCAHCGHDWPCHTVQALNGPDQTKGEGS